MSTLTIHEVKYFLPINPDFHTRMQWKKRFFYLKEAQEFIAKLEEGTFIEYTAEETKSAIFTEARGTPYRFLEGTFVTLGDFHDCRHSYRTTAYTTSELYEVAKAEYDAMIVIERKNQDAYYSQPWV